MRAEDPSRPTSPRTLFRGLLRSASFTLLAATLFGVTGCASVMSKKDDNLPEGLVYWLPKRDIKVTVTVSKDGTEVTAAAGDMEPDLSRKFVLDYQWNLIGTNALNVTVNAKGLLGGVVSQTTVKLSDVLKEIAKPGTATRERQAAAPTCAIGTYQRLVPAKHEASGELCEYTIKVTRLAVPPKPVEPDDFYSDWGRSGIYYRQELPYKVEITRKDKGESADQDTRSVETTRKDKGKPEHQDKRDFLVLSPSESPVYFLPVRRTLFSDNKADLEFNEGVPTKYSQTTDGELIGLLKLPAEVIGAYFGAIGEIFKYKKGALDNQQQYIAAQEKLAVEIVKFQACKEAINLGTKGDELKAACGVQ